MIDFFIKNWIEIIGTIAGLIYIFLEIKQNMWLWYVGIITSALYVVVFFQAKFYADMALNIYYVVISIYGWYWWKFGNKESNTSELPISRLRLKLGIILFILTAAFMAVITIVLIRYTDSTLPYYDALIASLSITATWMLTRKIIEQWFVWIVANGIAMGVYLYKDLYPTTLLFFVYFSLSIVGYITWNKQMKQQ